VVTAGVAVALVAAAVPAGAAKKPPVSLPGKVSNQGVGTVKSGAVAIDAEDFAFDKTFLKGAAGTVEVTVTNTGAAPHTFTVDGQDVDVQLAPGDEKTVSVDVTSGTPTAFYCRFHRGSGMQGAFFTKKGAASTTTGAGASAGGGSYGY